MRVLIVTCEFSPFAGGVGSFNRDLAMALQQLGHKVTVFTRDYAATMPREQSDVDSSWPEGVEIIRVPWPHPLGFFTVPLNLKRFLLQHRSEFDRLLITSSKAHAVASKLPLELLGKYSIIVHGDEADRHFGKSRGRLALLYRSSTVRRFFTYAWTVLGISNCTVERLAKYGFRSHRIFLGVDSAQFFPEKDPVSLLTLRRSFGADEHTRLVVSASRLELAKGQDVLIQVFSKLAEDFPDVRLVIAGEGRDRQALEQLARDSAAASRILFLGSLPRKRLRELFQISCCFAMISRRGPNENFGLVFLEANACGKAVIGGRTGGVPEAVADGVSGLLVNPESVDETEAALIKLLSDPDYCGTLAEQGYRRYLDGFTHVHMAQQILDLMQP